MAHLVTQIKSRSVLGATELTLMAPIKRGLILALDSRSYHSRAKLVLDTLHVLGISRREIDPTPAITEVADTIRSIRSFRLAIVGDPKPQILLTVAFDGGWEPYMRRIWRPLGPLLDLIFCNCDGYLLSSTHGFPAYAGWVRQAQVESGFYYEANSLTVSDQHLLKDTVGRPSPAPAALAGSLYDQARAAVVAFYRLTDMYPDQPGNEDGVVLRRAARLLLGEVSDVVGSPPPGGFLQTATQKQAWRWFEGELPVADPLDRLDPCASAAAAKAVDLYNVQAGILEPHPCLAHGRIVLIGLDDAASVAAFIGHFEGRYEITREASPYYVRGRPFVNLAFTYAGLVLAGVDRGTLDQLPQEFREGMEARAGILGDWERNHPQHWTLPQRHGGKPSDRVQPSTVHAVVQFWIADQDSAVLDEAVKALDNVLQRTRGRGRGRVLAVQPMQRISNAKNGTIGHFDFADGISQPGLAAAWRLARDTVAPGDLLLGYSNGRNDKVLRGRLWTDSTFLVVRKLRQEVKAFNDLQLSDDAKASLMGCRADGTNLVNPPEHKGNDFDYTQDSAGTKCPLHAHVRRANPRSERRNELDHLPRIVRRGMSYGPPYANRPDEERGLMFMAYNASIAEQFEVVQGWLAGGNSSGPGSFSGLRDPFVGVAREGDPRHFSWAGGCVDLPANRPLVTLQWGLYAFAPSILAINELRTWACERALEDKIEDIDDPNCSDDADALQRKRDRRTRELARQAAIGSELITRLQQVEQALGFEAAVEQWKLALEDIGARMSGRSQAIWTAVRQAHGGALRTPYGVLVCSKTLVKQVFANVQGNYTVSGYNTRLAKSFGAIYLGRDQGQPCSSEVESYKAESGRSNPYIMAVTQDQAFESAYGHTTDLLQVETTGLAPGGDTAVEVRDLVDSLLARLCKEWFGLPDDEFVKAGGWHWRDEATCPGHFHAPSRYTFQPQPGKLAREVGEKHGQLLKQQVLKFVRATRGSPEKQGRLGRKLFAAIPDDEHLADDDRLVNDRRRASNLIGVMMGFLPTVDGNLRGALYEWISDRSLWDHQVEFNAISGPYTTLGRAQALIGEPLVKAMQLRPVPEVVWRTALRSDTLGQVEVRPGDTVVVSIVSATQEDLLNGKRDPFVVFGGKRKPGPDDDTSKPIPTHACPGYDMAFGVMLGFLAALMETASLRPALSPMSLRIGKR